MAVQANRAPAKVLRLPTFGLELRRLREERRLSRERLAFATSVSSSYVSHLESGARERPTREVVEALIRHLHLVKPIAALHRRYLLELAAGLYGDVALDDPGELLTPELLHALELHEPNPAAYIDHRANVLACNVAYTKAFPGLGAGGNVLEWTLCDEVARQVLRDWEDECVTVIGYVRTSVARIGDAAWAERLFADFADHPVFHRIWQEGPIVYHRESSSIRLSDIETGRDYAVVAGTWSVPGPGVPDRVQLFLGVRVPVVPHYRRHPWAGLRCERAQGVPGDPVFLGLPHRQEEDHARYLVYGHHAG